MKVVQVFEVGIVLECDDQTDPVMIRDVLDHLISKGFEAQAKEQGTEKWPVAHTVTFKNEFLRREK